MSIYSLPANRGAFLWHRFALSAVVLALFLGLVRFAWYPGLYFQLGGVGKLVGVLIVVILLVGPGLSTLVYKPGKRGLKMDLVIIFIVEMLALAYFGNELFERRPQYLVFAIDRLQVVEANRVADLPYRFEELRSGHPSGPQLVNAKVPEDPAERAALSQGILLQGEPDIDVRPDHWYPYDEAIPTVLLATRPLADLRQLSGAHAEVVDHWLSQRTGESGDYVFLPVAGRHQDAAAVLSRSDGYPVDMLDLDPWD